MKKTWKDLNEQQIEELVNTLRFSDDIYRIYNNEEREDLTDALWTYLDRNPFREKEINEVVNTLFPNLKKYYMETVITPHHSGFGMYQVGEFNGDKWEDKDDLLQEIRNNVDAIFILGEDELPDEIEDIRGKIYNEPETVFAWINEYNEVFYGGIGEFEAEE